MQHDRLLVHTNHRFLRVQWLFVDRQDVLHAPDISLYYCSCGRSTSFDIQSDCLYRYPLAILDPRFSDPMEAGGSILPSLYTNPTLV